MASIDEVWPRIRQLAGTQFRQKGGKAFTYRAGDNYIELETTNRNISRTAFEKALSRVPFTGPAQVNDLSAPSYIYGILHGRARHWGAGRRLDGGWRPPVPEVSSRYHIFRRTQPLLVEDVVTACVGVPQAGIEAMRTDPLCAPPATHLERGTAGRRTVMC